MKKIGLCKLIRKFGANAYDIELPYGIGIAPIFHIVDLYPYRAEDARAEEEQKDIQCTKKIPIAETHRWKA
jgi:hypothetical protein